MFLTIPHLLLDTYLLVICLKNKNSIDWGPTYILINKAASGWHFLFKFTKRKRKSAEAMIGSIHHRLSKGDCIIKRVRDLNFLHFLQSFTEKCNKIESNTTESVELILQPLHSQPGSLSHFCVFKVLFFFLHIISCQVIPTDFVH